MLRRQISVQLMGLAMIVGFVVLRSTTAMGQGGQSEIETYGSMHETIGQQQHQGRVKLADLTRKPHFYAVGALERLTGEISMIDGKPIVTSVGADGKLKSLGDAAGSLQATLLVGGSVPEWNEVRLSDEVEADDFDKLVGEQAEKLGVDTSRPFLFLIDGEFTDVRLHVINGACPLHSRLRNKPIAENQKPFEMELNRVSGKLVGVFARDAAGKLTHPATSVHAHLIFEDQDGRTFTGHLERVALGAGTTLRIPLARKNQ